MAPNKINDFVYSIDPLGAKCPLGAHVRRTNPRDIGGRGEAGRHRILRRGISYGGPLLGENVFSDDETRGLLFVAANARIDVQFEVIQSQWMNSGEFLGQADLGRCPILGAHDGRLEDSFLEAGAVAPVNRLPRFVKSRGGDYFFAPGVQALRDMACGAKTFAPQAGELPYEGHALADNDTPSLFARERLQRIGQGIIRGRTARNLLAARDQNAAVTFVAKHADVKRVLRTVDHDVLEFSVEHYHTAAKQITDGGEMLIGTDLIGPTQGARDRLSTILNDAWRKLHATSVNGQGLEARLRASVKAALDVAIQKAKASKGDGRGIDLVGDLAAPATHAVIAEIFGIPGPNALTGLAVAMADSAPVGPPERTMLQIWSALILADLIGNIQNQGTLHGFARLAASEMLAHIRQQLTLARGRTITTPTTLLEAMVCNAANLPGGAASQSAYYNDVEALLLEITGTSMATIPLTFASVMDALFNFRIDLAGLAPLLKSSPPAGATVGPNEPTGLERLVYEAERLNPNMPIRMRYCVTDTTLSNGDKITAGEWVGCLIEAANLDARTFKDPLQFSLHPYVDPKAPVRNWENYLLFGDEGSQRKCWGRDRVAMVVLTECLDAASRLKRLRRPAGPGGKPKKLVGVTVGLPARFTRVV